MANDIVQMADLMNGLGTSDKPRFIQRSLAMRHALRCSIVPILLSSVLAVSQADARGGGGGHGGGFHGGFRTGFHGGFRGRGFVHRGFFPNRFVIHHRFGFNNGFSFGDFGWPIGDWDWGGGYAYPQAQAAPAQPQVIVINTDGQGRMQTADASDPPVDVSYLKGCHAIPNGYHCDLPNERQ
jgi:hypothetical protein